MGFLSRLIGSEKNFRFLPAGKFRSGRATAGVAYDPELVGRLKEEHEVLLHIFNAIERAAAEGHFHLLPELLTSLKLAFQTHIMLENVKFYSYLQDHLGSDPETSDFISEVHKDMDSVARALVRFVNTHIATLTTLDTVANFTNELDEIGTLLLWRVKLEEGRLYSLYQPH